MSDHHNHNSIHPWDVRIRNEDISMSVSCHGHPLSVLRPRLADQGIVTARDLRRIPTDTRVRVTGLPVIIHTPPTKSGKRVMFITMEDETGLMDLVAFPKAQKRAARAIYTSQVLTLEGRLQRQGEKGLSISVVVDRVIASLSGSLSDFLHSSLPQKKAGHKDCNTGK
jgi:DNA polymerase III alpha subunit